MISKDLIIKIIMIFLLVSCNEISKKNSQKKESTFKDYNIEKFLTKPKTESLNKIINNFDNHLKENYSEFLSPEERMFKFTNDLLKFYYNYTSNVTVTNQKKLFNNQKILSNTFFFDSLIKNLEETNLLDDILTTKKIIKRSDTINSWVNSILLKEGIEMSNEKLYPTKLDSIEDDFSRKKHKTKYHFNCKSEYYYSIYKISKPTDVLIREYIENIISHECVKLPPQDYLQRFLKSIPKEKFNNPLLKVVIFTEFYLPLLLTKNNY